MTALVEKMTFYSEDGNPDHPGMLEVVMDGSRPECPVTFSVDGAPVFSMGSDEIEDFCRALTLMNPEP